MADAHHADAPAHHGPNVQAYLVVFGALSIFTLVSFLANWMAHPDVHWISRFTSFAIILGVAVVKACLVGIYFMHLKWDWGRLYFLIIPAFILGAMMGMVLLPDIVLAW
jgi:cytochrome c oxidase subunit 4